MAKRFVGAPFLAEFDRRAFKISMVLLELAFETREQRNGVGSRTSKPGEDAVVVQPADFFRAAFHDGFAQRYLAVTGERNPSFFANEQHGGAANAGIL